MYKPRVEKNKKGEWQKRRTAVRADWETGQVFRA